MVALLALVPMRRRAFVRLELGASVLVREECILLSLPGDLTKNGLPWSCKVPEAILPLLRAYINQVRPWFLRRGNTQHNILWVGDRGTVFAENYFGMKMSNVTEELVGGYRRTFSVMLLRQRWHGCRQMRPC